MEGGRVRALRPVVGDAPPGQGQGLPVRLMLDRDETRRILEERGPMTRVEVRGWLGVPLPDSEVASLTRQWPDLCEDDDGRLGFTWQHWDA